VEFGKVEYFVGRGDGPQAARVTLTLIGQGDEDTLRREGLAGLRRKRIVRLTREAVEQGVLLGYEDLSGLLLTSLATLKRDVGHLERRGVGVSLRGRRRNGTGDADG
jgi:hypothetical protein